MGPNNDLLEAGKKAFHETAPGKLDDLSIQELQSRYQAMSRLYPHLDALGKGQYSRRIELVKQEIRHREISGVGDKTLTWARIAAVAGIAAIPVAVAALIYQIYFSKVPLATSGQASPPTYLQIPTPTTGSPEPAANSSSATPSPEPTATVRPSASPLESSD